MILSGQHDETLTRPLPHDELVQLAHHWRRHWVEPNGERRA